MLILGIQFRVPRLASKRGMMSFSDRLGITEPKSILQVEGMDNDLRNGLWQACIEFYFRRFKPFDNDDAQFKSYIRAIYVDFFKQPSDIIPFRHGDGISAVRSYFFSAQWWDAYNFIEFLVRTFDSKKFIERVSFFLEREKSGYRIVDNYLVPITDPVEVAAVSSAASVPNAFSGAREHIQTAIALFSRKPQPDFRHAFGTDLFPFRAGGGSFPLYVGDKPLLASGEDELSRSFIDRLRANAVPLHEQGDGMRSFASVLLHVLASDHHSIQFLDEPEAFLHPPQARLIGEFIAERRTSKSQLFIATHSTDILDGLISGGAEKVRIVRIQRDGTVNRVKELSKTKTAAIVKDTLARYSRVFDGIFYQHVVICEADADCLFYSSILNTKAISGDRRADVLFIHTAGKHRMAQLAETLRQLDVPVSVIADVDLLKEENTCKQLFETMGSDWSEVSGHFNALKNAVGQRRPPLNAEQVASSLRSRLDGIGGTGEFPKSAERDIKAAFKTLSPWDDVKRAGRSALPAGQAVKHYDEFATKAASVGLWIVPVGEIEGFCRSIDGGHGPGFVAKVLEERLLETDPELNEAREFVSRIWARARPQDTKA